jgi:hypothetical protein
MSRNGQGPADATRAALDLLARTRRALAGDDLPELECLLPQIEALRVLLTEAPPADRAQRRGELLALLDEAGRLAAQLGAEHDRLAAQLRESGSRRRAGAAYRRAGRL